MALVDLIMPKMGESIMEATILNWLKQVGDAVEVDENILEIATDKVDSEIPSPVKGVIAEILHPVDAVVPVGHTIARIETEASSEIKASPAIESPSANGHKTDNSPSGIKEEHDTIQPVAPERSAPTEVMERAIRPSVSNRFYSPLVRQIASEEGMTIEELDRISGSGLHDRVTKQDILSYLETRRSPTTLTEEVATTTATKVSSAIDQRESSATSTQVDSKKTAIAAPGEEIIEMDRMRKLIADHMVMSKHTSPHVTSFVEADVTHLVQWREKNKNAFQSKYGEKITFTPIFMEAVLRAIADYPMINVSVVDGKIIKKNYVHLGMATALPSGNLIVPVIKNADRLNLLGLSSQVNDLANRARQNQLKPEEIQGGTFTITNVGTFGNVMGTPIINQPQVAILATGAIRKKPAVVETEYGDMIVVRQMMFLSLSYDHRVVDGFLGGSFLRRVADYLEEFDQNRSI